MRSIGLDVHRDFCEVAIAEAGEVRSAGRIDTEPEALELFAQSLAPTDQVTLETTGPAMAIARILEPHVDRVVLASATEIRAISHARVKSDRFDARTLARLLDAGMLEAVWVPDPAIGDLRRRVARRSALVRQRVRAKNEVHAALMRCLAGRPPVSDLFGVAGRRWLESRELGEAERESVEGCLRQIDYLGTEIEAIDRKLSAFALQSEEMRRLMTIPGVSVGTAAALWAAIGDVHRFSSARKLVAYLGLDPKVRQSGNEPARHGHISKRGNSQARALLVEAAWTAIRTPGPLRAFGERVRERRGAQIAAVAVARKLTCIAWQMLIREEDYAHARPSLTRQKLRKAERLAGAPPLSTRHTGPRVSVTPAERKAEINRQLQGELAYRRLVADRRSLPGEAKGAGPQRGAHLEGISEESQAARQDKASDPAL
jgi:transposase